MLQTMLEMSEKMLASAQNEDWEALEKLQLSRAELIEKIFSQPLDTEFQTLGAGILEQTLEINQTVTELCLKQRNEVSQAALKLRQGRKLKKIYESS